MGKEDRQRGSTHSEEPRQGMRADEQGPSHLFEETSTLREPAAPLVPRRDARPASLQEAREATEALLREILEEGPEDGDELELTRSSSHPPSSEDDWPTELHPLHFSDR